MDPRPAEHAMPSTGGPDHPAVGELFATLSRRASALVDQQHLLLERLEQREEDPQRLHGLFGIDHVAARLRRNSNALLVIAGLPTARTITEPVSMSEVAHAAMSEVDGYQRVRAGWMPTDVLDPGLASDLVHLLAELIENSLARSSRASRVWVHGERSGARTLLVQVSDSGAGLGTDELEALNAALRGDVPYTGGGEEAGLFIVRSLAARHGIDVELGPAPEDEPGVVASVRIPVRAPSEDVAPGPTPEPDPPSPPDAPAVTDAATRHGPGELVVLPEVAGPLPRQPSVPRPSATPGFRALLNPWLTRRSQEH